MAEPFAAWELARKAFENVEQDVIDEIRRSEQSVLGQQEARGLTLSNSTLPRIADEFKRLIDDRTQQLLPAIKRALIAKPPDEISADTLAWTVNVLMGDLGRYYNHGSLSLRRVANNMYVDGLPPNLDTHQSRLRKRIEAEIEITLAEIQKSRLEPSAGLPVKLNSRHVFVVHGRNERHLAAVKHEILTLGLLPLILRELPNRGRTIIEKFEDYSAVPFAVVILSGDDEGNLAGEQKKRRPRQNVLFELGFFIGRLGRKCVCALHEPSVEIPSDYHGVAFVRFDDSDAWKTELRRELEAAGFKPSLAAAAGK
jgi:predicted nucleotide-binding protein